MKIISVVALFVWITLLGFSVYRDLQMVNQDGFGDLRNRVVGARLIKDGKSPYWYKWKMKDGPRYYDRWNIFPLKITNITASPFFLHLLQPVADINQKKLSRYWLFLEYLIYFLIVLAALLLRGSNGSKNTVLLVPLLLFFLTVPWIAHTSLGQNYLFIPLLLLTFLFILYREDRYFLRGLCCGAIAVAAILIRPFLILFFIPYLFRYKQVNRCFMMAAVIPLLLTGIWFFVSKTERLYWSDYSASIAEQVKYHQGLNPAPARIDTTALYTEIEGVNLKNSINFRPEMAKKGVVLQFQTTSVYKNFLGVFHLSVPVAWLNITGAGICILLLVAYWPVQRRETKMAVLKEALLGFCLYFVADIFSPVYRGEYAAVAWLFPLAVLPAFYKDYLKYPYLLFFIGFVLNIFYFKVYKIQYAIGEYTMFLALLWMVFMKPRNAAPSITTFVTATGSINQADVNHEEQSQDD